MLDDPKKRGPADRNRLSKAGARAALPQAEKGWTQQPRHFEEERLNGAIVHSFFTCWLLRSSVRQATLGGGPAIFFRFTTSDMKHQAYALGASIFLP